MGFFEPATAGKWPWQEGSSIVKVKAPAPVHVDIIIFHRRVARLSQLPQE
jgi:hypothetical protein